MAVRAAFEKSGEIGCFATLTNSYALVGIGGSENFYRYVIFLCVCAGRVDVDGSVFEAELGDVIPVVHTSIGGTRIIGRLTAGTHPLLPFPFPVFAAQGLLPPFPLISTTSPFRNHWLSSLVSSTNIQATEKVSLSQPPQPIKNSSISATRSPKPSKSNVSKNDYRHSAMSSPVTTTSRSYILTSNVRRRRLLAMFWE
jgi:hypothetical protein